jgi:hypothetical protein
MKSVFDDFLDEPKRAAAEDHDGLHQGTGMGKTIAQPGGPN